MATELRRGNAVGLEIVELDDAEWYSFVRSQRDALPFHHPAWASVVADCYGYPSFVGVQRGADGTMLAGVPVIEVRDPFRRRRWLSLPFTDECPFLAPPDEMPALAACLEAACVSAGARALEVRGGGTTRGCPYVAGVIHELELEADADAVQRRFRRPQVKQDIRRADRERVVVRRASSPRDGVTAYYELHVRTRRRLGVPTQPRRLFEVLWERMIEPGLGLILLAYHGNTPIAGAVFLAWNGHLTYKFSASEQEHWSRRPNYAILWNAIRWGCERGFRTLDFGRSSLGDAGLRAFKSNWGAVERPLIYTSLVGSSARDRPEHVSQAAAAILRRSPLWLCRGIGAALYRYAA
jgi:CelD/BcsL family acetyltransferase involved in cellulose biosynthesis